MRRVWILFTISFAALLLSACGGAATPEPLVMTIEMSEYAFSPEQIEVQVGQEVTFNLVNVGDLEHEIMFGRDVMIVDGRPAGYSVDMFEMADVEPMVEMQEGMEMEDDHESDEGDHAEDDHSEDGHEGFMVLLPAGDETATLSFTVTEDMVGEWEIGCFELDGVHYDAGMVGTLIVTE